MAEEISVPGVLQLQIGSDQGGAPTGVAYIFCRLDGTLAMRNGGGPVVVVGGLGLHLKESHVMLAMSETEVSVP